MIKNIFSKFKWYRKWKGGIWYRNRYIYDAGRVLVFCWSQHQSYYHTVVEDYNETIQERRKRIISEIING